MESSRYKSIILSQHTKRLGHLCWWKKSISTKSGKRSLIRASGDYMFKETETQKKLLKFYDFKFVSTFS
jgi:hypothetical protein